MSMEQSFPCPSKMSGTGHFQALKFADQLASDNETKRFFDPIEEEKKWLLEEQFQGMYSF